MSLIKNSKTAQGISDAIFAVLDVDVTIADKDLIRVAATGKYKDVIGQRLPEGCSFERTALSKKPKFIKNPNSEECADCSSKGSCFEKATLGYPILDGDQLIGVIGLIAFESNQKQELFDKYDSLLDFLSNLSDLLVTSIKEKAYIKKLKVQDELINLTIDNLDSGIIYTDIDNKILFLNSVTVDKIKLAQGKIIGKDMADYLPLSVVNIRPNIRKEVKLDINGHKESFIFSRIPILVENNITGNLYTIHDSSKIIHDAYNIMNVNLNIDFNSIIGESKEINEVKELAKNVARSKSTIMIRGESGTGKELFARAIHNESPRRNEPFIAINCASIPENLLESELFGYEEGAFTGASKSGKIGKFELANNGTLFLDEIGDLPLHLQPKLLRVLQEESFTKLGGKDLISVNFRLITATNQNLEEMVEKGQYRDDLYYRLSVIPIEIPPLKDRGEDINILSKYGLQKYMQKLNKSNIVFSDEVKDIFRSYSWPGNIRELENCIEYLVNTIKGNVIMKSDLPKNLQNFGANDNRRINASLKDIMDDYENKVIKGLIKEYGATAEAKVKISEILDINLATLYRKLNKYNL
ncbi:MAG: sigma 54-interacting transcriptional regulator [Tissierellia bacterium]|nr:sigma 54-interacting transcriptional regulator [Tissierellia bacterium]